MHRRAVRLPCTVMQAVLKFALMVPQTITLPLPLLPTSQTQLFAKRSLNVGSLEVDDPSSEQKNKCFPIDELSNLGVTWPTVICYGDAPVSAVVLWLAYGDGVTPRC
ncbi:hypothetical protein PoB_004044400 [Plakobranchus ocellatus]|uniref:Secreted protein n=1 Tax=Plakobranchus ocellatus TaxID=259542 RepID=A0AAV4B1R0_9GAST|nr:hypothetical protein PoB_004044400 [Plakobranchus ocellatus]